MCVHHFVLGQTHGQTRGHDPTLWSPNHSKRLGTSNEIIISKIIALPRIAQPWFRRLEVQYRVTWWQANVTRPISPFNVDIRTHLHVQLKEVYRLFNAINVAACTVRSVNLRPAQSFKGTCMYSTHQQWLPVPVESVRTYTNTMYEYYHNQQWPTSTSTTSTDVYECCESTLVVAPVAMWWRLWRARSKVHALLVAV